MLEPYINKIKANLWFSCQYCRQFFWSLLGLFFPLKLPLDCLWPTGLIWHLMLLLVLQLRDQGETTFPSLVISSSILPPSLSPIWHLLWHTGYKTHMQCATRHWENHLELSLSRLQTPSPERCQCTAQLYPRRAVATLGWGCAQSN